MHYYALKCVADKKDLFLIRSVYVPECQMTQNDPEMTQKLPSFWIVDLSGKMRGGLGKKLGKKLGSDFALNDPEINGSNARVLGETG